MGSWNETCGLTHMPILDGDPVYGMFITQNPYKVGQPRARAHGASGHSLVQDLWERVSPLFKGVYADYGLIGHFADDESHLRECIHGAISSVLLSSADIEKYTGQEDTMAKYDGDTLDASKSFKGMLHMVERGRAFWQTTARQGKSVAPPIGLWMAHAWAVDALIPPKVLDEATADEMKCEVAFATRDDETTRIYRNRVESGFTTEYPRGEFGFKIGGVESTAMAVARTALLLFAMEQGRIPLHPQCGKGSQGDSLVVQVALANAVLQNIRPSFDDGTYVEEPWESEY